MCNLGRENVEAWGRRKREAKEVEDLEDMTLSQEILVLDFGDENPSEFMDNGLNSTRGKHSFFFPYHLKQAQYVWNGSSWHPFGKKIAFVISNGKSKLNLKINFRTFKAWDTYQYVKNVNRASYKPIFYKRS